MPVWQGRFAAIMPHGHGQATRGLRHQENTGVFDSFRQQEAYRRDENPSTPPHTGRKRPGDDRLMTEPRPSGNAFADRKGQKTNSRH
ncbi:hypothetical protein, partial [Bifidobacterium saguini]|uniref:hypothetical protein n=1 Tax=Bifidobacterium saguini TaxID=762210 RepID=UPI00053B418D